MTVYISKKHPLGILSGHQTNDGSFSLHSDHFKEDFHDLEGAATEANTKFLGPAQLKTFKNIHELRVLDICVGLGYNTACILETLQKEMPLKLNWWGLELDPRPISIALKTASYRDIWTKEVLKKLESLRDNNGWETSKSKGKILLGDARQCLRSIPPEMDFHLIMLDPFSPKHCPELWSEEFLQETSKRLTPNGRIVTYCRAAAVRATLRRAGLELRSITTKIPKKKQWSQGTVAIYREDKKDLINDDLHSKTLSKMEEEHLLTRASIPYRDPTGTDKTFMIHQRRLQEQKSSNLESTSSWQRRWFLNERD